MGDEDRLRRDLRPADAFHIHNGDRLQRPWQVVVQAGAGGRRVAAEGTDDAILTRLDLVDARCQPQNQHHTRDP